MVLHSLIVEAADWLASPQFQALRPDEFRRTVEEERRDLTSKNFTFLIKTLNDDALTLLTSTASTISTRNKIIGLNVMDALLEIQDEDMIRRRRDFGNLLLQVMKNFMNSSGASYDLSVVECACKTLGHFALIASTTDIEFVQEHFFKPTRDWIKDDKYPVRRVTAVLILRVLLNNAPALFYSKKLETFQDLWRAVFDTKEKQVRERSAETLGTFLMFVHQVRELFHQIKSVKQSTNPHFTQRERTDHFYSKSLEQAETGLASNSNDKMHGSLLVIGRLLRHPTDLKNTDVDYKLTHTLADSLKELMKSKFTNFAKCITDPKSKLAAVMSSKKDGTASSIRLAVIALIPNLASFDESSDPKVREGGSGRVKIFIGERSFSN